MTYVIAFDFESFGPIPTIHGFTQLGAIIGNLTSGHIIDTFSMYANQSCYSVDNNCIETFWLKTPERFIETLEKCNESKIQPQEVVELFINWIKKFVNEKGESIYLITDCSTYDTSILKTFSLCNTLKLINNIPRDIIDTTSFYLGVSGLFMTEDIVDGNSFELACKKLKLPEFNSVVKHDHNPVNDSTVIFQKWKFINDGIMNISL
jgi:hypothetical protein